MLVRGLAWRLQARISRWINPPQPEVWAIAEGLRNAHVTGIVWSFTQDFDESTYRKFGLSKYFDKCFYPSDF